MAPSSPVPAVRGATWAAALLAALAAPAPAVAQARAEPSDSTRTIVLGLAALAALGLALRQRDGDDDDREREVEVEDDGHEEEVEEERGRDDGRRGGRRLPARCLRDWSSDEEGRVRLYDPDCLRDRLRNARYLPDACAVTVRADGRFITGYSPSCLAEEGWRRERR